MSIYMRLSDKGSSIPAIMGDVTTPGYQGWIALESVQPQIMRRSSVSSATSGVSRVTQDVKTLLVSKLSDRSSVKLFGLATSGQAFDGRIDIFNDGSQLPYLSYILTNVIITNVQLSGHSGRVAPAESVELSSTKIDVVYKAAA